MTAENLYLSTEQYLSALKKLRDSAGVSYLYLDLYLARRARDLSQSDTVAQSLSEAIEGALAADEAKTIGAMLKCARALEWIEGAS